MGDYDLEPRSAKSTFLRLKDKGESVRVRIASKPYREPKVWKEGETRPMADENAAKLTEEQWARIMSDPDYNITEVFSWIVIDRADGVAKIFSGTPGIYKSIKELATQDDWGDPTRYDLTITRTEEPGRGYYKVQPSPNKSDLTDKEQQQVEQLDIRSQLPNARPTAEKQIDNIDTFMEQNSTETASIDGVGSNKKPKPEDITIEDMGEPINLDDIPF